VYNRLKIKREEKMKKYLAVLVALVVIAALLITACGPPTPTTTAPPIITVTPTPGQTTTAPQPTTTAPQPTTTKPAAARKIRLSYTMPKGNSIGGGFEWFATELTKRSNGKYFIETYASNTLTGGTTAGALAAVRSGVVDMAGTSAGTFPSDFPLSLVVSIPTLSINAFSADQYVDAADALLELLAAVPEVKAEFKGFQLLNSLMLDAYNIVSKKKEIHLPSDFKGLRVGGSGSKMDIVTQNGGVRVQMIPPESYLNLDKGVVDAGFLTMAQVSDYKLYEICDYFYLGDFGGGYYFIMMAPEVWNSLPPADQKLFTDVWKESRKVSGQTSLDTLKKGTDAALAANKKVVNPTATEIAEWEKAAQIAVTSWINDCKRLGIAQEVIDRTLAKWKEIRTGHVAKFAPK